MNKETTIAQFIFACYLTIECSMCGERRADDTLDDDDLTERVWKEGWRIEDGRVLCQYCTDNKR